MKALLLLSFLVPSLGYSYPVFFKCEANGRMTDQLTPAELNTKLRAMVNQLAALPVSQRSEKISSYCEGGAQCMQELTSLLTLAKTTQSITDEVMNAELAGVRARAAQTAAAMTGAVPMPAGAFASAVNYNQTVESIALARECRVAADKMSPDHLKWGTEQGNCILGYFNHSPYMYATGVRESGQRGVTQHQGATRCEAIKDLALGAIAMDEDPYAAVAISLMENGTSLEGLYLDPIGAVQTLGCPTSPGSATNHNLDSFNTYYNVQYGAVENAQLANRVRDYLTLNNANVTPGTSYACAGGKDKFGLAGENCSYGGSTATICTTPQEGACCARLPFTSPEYGDLIGQAITYSSFKRYLGSPLADNVRGSDPNDYAPRRIQRFNGYSTAMGGAEAVSAWRSGVNYYQTPAYGYQAMDFVMNSLWNNPFVRQAVEEAEGRLNRRSKSVFCQDKQPGVYTIEHDHYFQKHANSPRMTAIQAAFNQNPSWEGLSRRYQNVLRGEFSAICRNGQYMMSSFCNADESTAKVREYFSTIYPQRRTVAQASRMDQGYEWGEMTEPQFGTFLNTYSEFVSSVTSYSSWGKTGSSKKAYPANSGDDCPSCGMVGGSAGGEETKEVSPENSESTQQ